MRQCNICKNTYDLNHFRKDSSRKDGLHKTCNTCNAAIQRNWYNKNKEKARKNACERYHKNKEEINKKRKIDRQLNPNKYKNINKRNYDPSKRKEQSWKKAGILDMTIEKYNEILESQNHKCAVCNKPSSFFKKALGVDHNHITGKYRGILCDNCNRALGYLKESEEIIINLLNYVKWHKETTM